MESRPLASHQTASLAARERLALSGPRGAALCEQLAARDDVLEIAAIATCNRSELYLVATDAERVTVAAVEAFAALARFDADELSTVLCVHHDEAAAEHLFRVAGGIESVVTGEAQIQGQLRAAHDAAREQGTCGPVLDRLFRRAVEIGKRQGKTVIVVGDGPGFYTSRALGPYLNEASFLLSEGVPVEAIDAALVR